VVGHRNIVQDQNFLRNTDGVCEGENKIIIPEKKNVGKGVSKASNNTTE
jgi:hypothetical protein